MMPSLDSPADSPAPFAASDGPALPVVEEVPPEPAAGVATTTDAPPPDNASLQAARAVNAKDEAAAPSILQSRKPQPVRRPLNSTLRQSAPATQRPHPTSHPAIATQRSHAPDSARALRETAYFGAIPGENLTVPKPPASTGPANFPNSPFGKAAAGSGGDGAKKGTVRVVGKSGSIVNVPHQLMA